MILLPKGNQSVSYFPLLALRDVVVHYWCCRNALFFLFPLVSLLQKEVPNRERPELWMTVPSGTFIIFINLISFLCDNLLRAHAPVHLQSSRRCSRKSPMPSPSPLLFFFSPQSELVTDFPKWTHSIWLTTNSRRA